MGGQIFPLMEERQLLRISMVCVNSLLLELIKDFAPPSDSESPM